MIAFGIECSLKSSAQKLIDKVFNEEEHKEERISQLLSSVSNGISDKISIFCESIHKNTVRFIALGSEKTWNCRAVEKAMKSAVDEVLDTDSEIACKEITVWSFTEGLKHAENNRCLSENSHYITNQNAIDYFENRQYKVKQRIYEADGFNFESAIREAECLLCDSTMVEEIERIYSEDNPKLFKGHPVHYRISCSENDAAFGVVGLLIKALVENKRLFGCRADVITEIQEGCYDEVDLDNVIMVASGNAVIIDTKGMRGQMQGNFATAYEEVVRFFDALIRKYSNDVLFIFLEDTEYPGFSKSLLSTVQEYMNLIEIKEGRGDTKKARKYIEYIVKNSELSDYAESAMEQIVLEEPEYTVSELHKIYNKWRSKCLSKCVYKSYAHYEAEPIGVKRKESDQKLEDLVGLDKVKVIANQIMATHVIDRRRMSATVKCHEISKHMIFTGNPGTAKTTVARILARMLKDEEVLETGKFIECGRADLVAKYVGWTAGQVQKKFRQADGGILFIDEAYALVDEAGSFGDEAINTIVQEMENYRDRVIVIFAGYPDKMKTFLEKNEGLRSRIAFYVDFPDYKADELMQILDVMLEQREYRMTDAARKRAFEIIADGMRQPDFGNGRFVRNVLEQAIMRQSVRLYNEYKGKTDIPKEVLLSLKHSGDMSRTF